MVRTRRRRAVLYGVVWLSTLMLAVDSTRRALSRGAASAQWALIHRTLRTVLSVVLSAWLLLVTRDSRTLEGELGWNVGWATLFLIDWARLAHDLNETLHMVTPRFVVVWGTFIAVLAWSAAALTRRQLHAR